MSIYTKLLEFQKKQITLIKKGDNPHFKSKYVPLNEVLENVLPELNALNILVIQTPTAEGLETVLIDTEDDSTVHSFLPYVEANTAQKLGSNNTYNRRYALVTMLGLGDKDDDGNEASGLNETPKTESKNIPQNDIPDGTHTVTVLEVFNGKSKTTGNPFQKVKTGDGVAWNNCKNGTDMIAGSTYTVTVKKGSIFQADDIDGFDDIGAYAPSPEEYQQ